jgi:hypothetical protein
VKPILGRATRSLYDRWLTLESAPTAMSERIAGFVVGAVDRGPKAFKQEMDGSWPTARIAVQPR